MKNILKSTTNTITFIVVLGTLIMTMYVIVMGVQEVNTIVFGAWTTLIGWVVGAKSSKARYETSRNDFGELNAKLESIKNNTTE